MTKFLSYCLAHPAWSGITGIIAVFTFIAALRWPENVKGPNSQSSDVAPSIEPLEDFKRNRSVNSVVAFKPGLVVECDVILTSSVRDYSDPSPYAPRYETAEIPGIPTDEILYADCHDDQGRKIRAAFTSDIQDLSVVKNLRIYDKVKIRGRVSENSSAALTFLLDCVIMD